MQFINSVTPDGTQIPTYRVLDGVGQLLDGAELPEVRECMFGVEKHDPECIECLD